jgi:hypothetical protein
MANMTSFMRGMGNNKAEDSFSSGSLERIRAMKLVNSAVNPNTNKGVDGTVDNSPIRGGEGFVEQNSPPVLNSSVGNRVMAAGGVESLPVLNDPRFEAMRLGQRGTSGLGQNQVLAGSGDTSSVVERPTQRGFNANKISGGSIRDEQTGETVSITGSGGVQRFDANGNPVSSISKRSWGAPSGGMQTADNGLQISGGNPSMMRQFTGETNALHKGGMEQAAELAAVQAKRDERVAAQMPQMPDTSGMSPRQEAQATEVYKAQLDSWDKSKTSDILGAHYKGEAELNKASADEKNLSVNYSKEVDSIRKELMADPNNKDLAIKLEIATMGASTAGNKKDSGSERAKLIRDVIKNSGKEMGEEKLSTEEAAQIVDEQQAVIDGKDITEEKIKGMTASERAVYDASTDEQKVKFIQTVKLRNK